MDVFYKYVKHWLAKGVDCGRQHLLLTHPPSFSSLISEFQNFLKWHAPLKIYISQPPLQWERAIWSNSEQWRLSRSCWMYSRKVLEKVKDSDCRYLFPSFGLKCKHYRGGESASCDHESTSMRLDTIFKDDWEEIRMAGCHCGAAHQPWTFTSEIVDILEHIMILG